MKLISERNTRDGLLKVYPLTTHPYSWLEQDYDLNFNTVERWCKDMVDKDMLLVPIHKADHWSLVVIDIRTKMLAYYDSIYGNRRRSNAPKVIKRFIEQYWGQVIKLKVRVMENAPLQGNGYDC